MSTWTITVALATGVPTVLAGIFQLMIRLRLSRMLFDVLQRSDAETARAFAQAMAVLLTATRASWPSLSKPPPAADAEESAESSKSSPAGQPK
ncbi:hypothetical protein D5S17_01615 [Pseudonocardiaceae bacterium YIM PH 21723]|nr:hypothetical protein D5S17_01615 [Pseudonocardiaceae bacterium YIM PH 21723]